MNIGTPLTRGVNDWQDGYSSFISSGYGSFSTPDPYHVSNLDTIPYSLSGGVESVLEVGSHFRGSVVIDDDNCLQENNLLPAK